MAEEAKRGLALAAEQTDDVTGEVRVAPTARATAPAAPDAAVASADAGGLAAMETSESKASR